MSRTPNFDLKVKAILDATHPGERVCELTGEKWMMTEEEISWYKKFNVPPSPHAPFTRWKQRTAAYTGYQFWYNKDYRNGNPIITHFHPATMWKVMPDKDWFQEDFSSINLDFNVDRPCFDLLRDLASQVPVNAYRDFGETKNSIGVISLGDVDSYFTIATKSLRCYYCADSTEIEDCMDVFISRNVTRSYDIVHSYDISDSRGVSESRQCFNCAFVFDCRNCESCYMSWNKRNKKYLWHNEQLSEGEWKKRFEALDLTSRSAYQREREVFQKIVASEAVWPETFNVHSENSSGEYLTNCTNCKMVYFGEESTDCSWSSYAKNSRDLFHADAPWSSNCYLCAPLSNSEGCRFSWVLVRCQDCEYSINCYDCEHCFGCVGLQKKKFHIFNKPYSEEEYWKHLDELKCAMLERGEYGQGIPARFTNGYPPETGMGWMFSMRWEELEPYDVPRFEPGDAGAFGPFEKRVKEAKRQDEVPDRLENFGEDWAGVVVYDADYRRPFAYQKHEIKFCNKFRIPPYNTHFLARFWRAQREMNHVIPLETTCRQCGVSVTAFKNFAYPNRTIYCKPCYLQYLEQHG